QGNQAIFVGSMPVPNGGPGSWVSTYEVRLQQQWTKHLFQVIQTNFGWDYSEPTVGTTNWGGVYSIFVYQLSKTLDTGLRTEWFDDPQGTVTGFPGNYTEVTINFDYHPKKWISLRPEVRGDLSDNHPVFNSNRKNQLTLAIDCLLKY